MALVKINLPYRIGVKFDKPLSTVAQLRELCKTLSTKYMAIVESSRYAASVIAVFPPGSNPAVIQYDKVWFRIGPSAAIVTSIRPEVTFKP